VPTLTSVRQHTYVDSVTLLQVTAELLGIASVEDAALVMATSLNQDVLRDAGLLVGEALQAGSNDLVLAVRALDEATARAALEQAEALLRRRRPAPAGALASPPPRSVRSAHRTRPDARVAVISVPGQFAAAEARQALAEGLHVFLFSDNVGLEAEVELKHAARERNLLVMGPDCGTSILGGAGFGFANAVRPGSIGIVGASGTGIQEVATLIHRSGHGVSHAIGTGSRDLHARVGGITTLQAIELLRQDGSTETIVLVSKPSDPEVAVPVLAALATTGKRAIAYLQDSDVAVPTGVTAADSLADAARLAVNGPVLESALPRLPRLGDSQRQVRGLFCGGTLAHEARAVLGADVNFEIVDFGDDEYTRGRAHPMIDPSLRNRAIARAGSDPRVAVLLLDFILGFGAHADPAGATLESIREALSQATAGGLDLSVVAHVVGTDQDPQGLEVQEATLRAAGVQVYATNAMAAQAARQMLRRVAA
jgi:FdrA protein